MFKFENGTVVRDRVTGFTGTILARTEWLNGCVRYNVQPRMVVKDGETQKLPDIQAFDEAQLERVTDAAPSVSIPLEAVVEPATTPTPVAARRTGGDQPTATRSPDPVR